jgi:hypothetical protein
VIGEARRKAVKLFERHAGTFGPLARERIARVLTVESRLCRRRRRLGR